MSRKDRKSNPDLTAEWRMEQDQIKNGQTPNPTPYQFSNNNFDNSYPYYQQPQQNIPPYNAPKPGADYYGFDNKKETSNVQNEQNKSRVKQNQKKKMILKNNIDLRKEKIFSSWSFDFNKFRIVILCLFKCRWNNF